MTSDVKFKRSRGELYIARKMNTAFDPERDIISLFFSRYKNHKYTINECVYPHDTNLLFQRRHNPNKVNSLPRLTFQSSQNHSPKRAGVYGHDQSLMSWTQSCRLFLHLYNQNRNACQSDEDQIRSWN